MTPRSLPLRGRRTRLGRPLACRRTSVCQLAMLLTAVMALNGCGRPAPPLVELPPPQVRVARPIARDVTEYVVFTGNAAAVAEVDIRARVSGFVTKVHFAVVCCLVRLARPAS